MKYTFLFIALMFVFIAFSKKSKPEMNQKVTIVLIDDLTNETLVGVKNGDKYSDFDGILVVDKDEPISLELISYEKLNNLTVKNDTIIKMSSIK